MIKPIFFQSLSLLFLGLSLQNAAQAQAQTSAPDEALLPEIRATAAKPTESPLGPVKGLVAKRNATATKTDTAIIETPQSVSVITRDQMDAQNVQSVSDAIRYTAGVMAEANGPDTRADVATIRGFSAGNRSSFRDGLRDYAFGGQGGVVIEPYSLERIEVLRGPASVLYGQGDAGGMINLVSKRPTPTPQHEVQLQYGSFGRKQAAFDVSGPVESALSSSWRYRVTGLLRDADSQTDYVKDDRTYFAPALTWQPSNDTSLTFLANYQKNERGQGYQALPRVGTLIPGTEGFIPTNRFVGEPGFERFDQTQTSVGYAFEHRANDAWTLRQNFRILDQETLYNSTFQAGLQGDGVTIDRTVGQGRERVRNLVLDNQAQWISTGPGIAHTVLVGLDHQRMRGVSGSLYTNIPALNVYNPVYGQALPVSADAPPDDTRKTLMQTGFYAQDQLKFGNRIAWTIGGRYDTTRSDAIDLASNLGDPQSDGALTGRTGLVYLFNDGWAPYIGYATSFTPILDKDAAGNRFKPETGQQSEIGVRYQPKNQDISFLTSLYYLRRQNVLTNDPADPNFSIQRGEVRSRGIELEVKAAVTKRLDLIATMARNDLKVTRSNGDDLGKTPSASPKTLASLWADWRVPGIAGLKLSGGARHVGSSFGDELETITVAGYTLFDAAIELDLARMLSTAGDWRLALNVSNLTDKTYVSTCGYFGDGCKYGYGRMAALTLNYRW